MCVPCVWCGRDVGGRGEVCNVGGMWGAVGERDVVRWMWAAAAVG